MAPAFPAKKPGGLIFWDSYLRGNQIGHVTIVWNPADMTTMEAPGTGDGVGCFSHGSGQSHYILEIWALMHRRRPSLAQLVCAHWVPTRTSRGRSECAQARFRRSRRQCGGRSTQAPGSPAAGTVIGHFTGRLIRDALVLGVRIPELHATSHALGGVRTGKAI
jgi:hypothetical protein